MSLGPSLKAHPLTDEKMGPDPGLYKISSQGSKDRLIRVLIDCGGWLLYGKLGA